MGHNKSLEVHWTAVTDYIFGLRDQPMAAKEIADTEENIASFEKMMLDEEATQNMDSPECKSQRSYRVPKTEFYWDSVACKLIEEMKPSKDDVTDRRVRRYIYSMGYLLLKECGLAGGNCRLLIQYLPRTRTTWLGHYLTKARNFSGRDRATGASGEPPHCPQASLLPQST